VPQPALLTAQTCQSESVPAGADFHGCVDVWCLERRELGGGDQRVAADGAVLCCVGKTSHYSSLEELVF